MPLSFAAVVALFCAALAVAQNSPQDVVRNLTPEQRARIQAKLPELRAEIQTLAPEKRIERATAYFESHKDLTPAQRLGLRDYFLQQAGYAPAQNTPPAPAHPLTALTDFGATTFQGKKGGLYPDGSNERPAAHNTEGLRIANAIKPLDANGKPDDANGRIVWLSIGMSNTAQATQAFFAQVRNLPELNPKLELVDGAFGGQAINQINRPDAPYWNNVAAQRLKPRGLTPGQVQIVWYKQAEMGPTETDFVKYTAELKSKYADVVRILKREYPNLKIVYMSPRSYGGYAKTKLNPEPFAWYTGWTIKFLIEDQINGAAGLRFTGENAPAPWLAWGPYLWADGEKANANGLSYSASDFGADGTHPSETGARKIGAEMLRFFTTDETAKPWFLRQQ
ncbi:MAG: DUF3106 domain-containing protein [Kiritimatiellaeota bacterium]|nr:DUF3106 domain-containing protein [Kiritimatiellota bacterium]